MIIDALFVVLLVLAVWKGYRRGLIVGVFSFVAIVIGLAAAMKLSAVAAGYIGDSVNVSQRWLPVLSFLLVFVIVVILVRLGANALEKVAEMTMLGWLNRLAGVLLYAAIYITIYSVVLFYAVQVNWIRPETIEKSVTYDFIQPWGPKAINALGAVIPWFRDLFTQLEQFFDGVSASL